MVDNSQRIRKVLVGRKITCPTLFLWGSEYIGKSASSPVDVWRRWAPDLVFAEIKSGHFLAEENPADVVAALIPFITAGKAT